LYRVRRNPDEFGIVIPKSTKCHYSWHDATRMGDAAWNNGRYLTEPALYAAFLERKLDKALNVLGLKRELTIRNIHGMKR
jgi:hypothetical protein